MLLSHPTINSTEPTNNYTKFAVRKGKREALRELLKHESISFDLRDPEMDDGWERAVFFEKFGQDEI